MKTEALVKFFQKGHGEARDLDPLVLDYLDALAVIEDDQIQKRLLGELVDKYVTLEKRVDALLKNTLPAEVAETIKYEGRFAPRSYVCTIVFVDIAGFTNLAEKIPGDVLIGLLDGIFSGFDDIVASRGGTKIKTIGDAYMAVFGAPLPAEDHAVSAVGTGLALLRYVDVFNRENARNLEVRIGIHTGKVMAGVVGKERMQFDVFGDNVNIASRFESSGQKGKVNVSHETYLMTKDSFLFEERGEIALKHKADMKAYFVLGEREAKE